MKHYITALSLLLFITNAEANTDQQRESYVIQAKKGDIQPALTALRKLYHQTHDSKVLNDFIAIDSWDGDVALDNITYNIKQLNNESLETLAKVYRNKNKRSLSQKLYQRLTQTQPNNLNGWLGLALVSAEKGDLYQARHAIFHYRKHFKLDDNFYTSWIYINKTLHDEVGEIAAWQSWHQHSPQNKQAAIGLFKSAIRLGAAPSLSHLVKQHPQWFTTIDKIWLDYYDATINLRNSNIAKSTPSLIKSAKQLEAIFKKLPKNHQLYKIAYYDHFYALVLAEEYQQAAPIAKQLQTEHQLPQYIKIALATYLQATNYPLKASRLYENVYHQDRVDLELSTKLYNSYMDSEQYDQAHNLLTTLLHSTPKRKWNYVGTIINNNHDYQDLLQLKAIHDAARGNISQSLTQLNDLLSFAPENPYLLLSKGDIESWRNNQNQAINDYQQAKLLLPPANQLQADKSIVFANIQRGAWDQISPAVEKINKTYPLHDTQYFDLAIKKAKSALFSAEYYQSKSKDSTINASHDWNYDTHLYSPRLSNGSQLFLHHQNSFGDYENSHLNAQYSGLGAELVYYPLSLTLEGGHGQGSNKKAYFWTNINYRLSDQWQLSANYQINAADTPLRALNKHTYVNKLSASINYSLNDLLNIGLTSSYSQFSDSNKRTTYSTWLESPLIKTDFYSLIANINMTHSHNNVVEQAEYFNPKSDLNSRLNLTQNYHLRLSDQLTLDQHLSTTIGRYWQQPQTTQTYGTHTVWDLNYSQTLSWFEDLELTYGIGRSKDYYDGNGEFNNYLFANFQVAI